MTTIKKGEKVFDKDGNLFATVNVDIKLGDKIRHFSFIYPDGTFPKENSRIEDEIVEFLYAKQTERN